MNAFQKAVYDHLKADTSLMGVISGVYDRVPQSAALPYVSFGSSEWRPYDAQCLSLGDESLQLDIWSDYQGGYKEANEVMARVRFLLHNQEIPAGAQSIRVIINKMIAFRDADGITTHGVIDLQAVM